MIATLRSWPRRRWAVAAAVFPLTTVLFALAGGGLPGLAPWWAWPWLILTGALATIVLASYLPGPGTGRLIDAGCTPCAAASAMSVVIAAVAHAIAPTSPVLAMVATAVAAMGTRRRLTGTGTCSTGPSVPPGTASVPGTAGTAGPPATATRAR